MTVLARAGLTRTDLTRPANLLAHARRIAANPRSWPATLHFDTADRWYTRLTNAGGYEAWLLTWLPGQQTGWHDHGGSAGAFVVVSGQLREDTASGFREMTAGVGRQFDARHVHRVVNDGTTPAVSIHVYSPALTSMTRYEMVGGSLRRLAVERAGADW
jgi:mannose-6-phosphate isomerase-like protein (cupin superfamily)